jgi:hypothetical protein
VTFWWLFIFEDWCKLPSKRKSKKKKKKKNVIFVAFFEATEEKSRSHIRIQIRTRIRKSVLRADPLIRIEHSYRNVTDPEHCNLSFYEISFFVLKMLTKILLVIHYFLHRRVCMCSSRIWCAKVGRIFFSIDDFRNTSKVTGGIHNSFKS